MGWLAAIAALLADIPIIDRWFTAIKGLWRKDPVKQVTEAEAKEKADQDAAKTSDKTDGLFGGSEPN